MTIPTTEHLKAIGYTCRKSARGFWTVYNPEGLPVTIFLRTTATEAWAHARQIIASEIAAATKAKANETRGGS